MKERRLLRTFRSETVVCLRARLCGRRCVSFEALTLGFVSVVFVDLIVGTPGRGKAMFGIGGSVDTEDETEREETEDVGRSVLPNVLNCRRFTSSCCEAILSWICFSVSL